MAKRVVDLMRSVDIVLQERKRLADRERQLVRLLSRAVGKMGYTIVVAKGGGRRRRRGRRPRRKPQKA